MEKSELGKNLTVEYTKNCVTVKRGMQDKFVFLKEEAQKFASDLLSRGYCK